MERAVRHILGDFNPDGSLKEYAPNYHAFETWHGRDDLALAGRLGRPVPAEAAERIRKAGWSSTPTAVRTDAHWQSTTPIRWVRTPCWNRWGSILPNRRGIHG